MSIRVRSALVEARTSLVNATRGLAKGMGVRVPDCDAASLDEGSLEPGFAKESLGEGRARFRLSCRKWSQHVGKLERMLIRAGTVDSITISLLERV